MKMFVLIQPLFVFLGLMRENQLILHLGSNQGDRIQKIQYAEELINSNVGSISARSHYYETEAWGNETQPHFINSALIVMTKLKPLDILRKIKAIELVIGREASTKWSPRIIDIDILFYGDYSFRTPRLNIPHRDLENRKFVLVPLLDIIPDYVHPISQLSITQLNERCSDPLNVSLYQKYV